MTFPTAAYKHSNSSYLEATEEVPENTKEQNIFNIRHKNKTKYLLKWQIQ